MLTITKFAGEIPKATPRLLPDNFAQIARNCKLIDGALVPLRWPAPVRTPSAGTVCFFKKGDRWFEHSSLVEIAAAPIAQDRIYMTGDGKPKMVVDSSTVYELGLSGPVAALEVAIKDGEEVDTDTQQSVLYAYTYVTIHDEESPPSPLSKELLVSPATVVEISNFVEPAAGRGINRFRLYRSQTSASGVTDLYFVYERVFPVKNPLEDSLELRDFVEPIKSNNYDPPPDDMHSIIALPNGMMAAISGKDLCFSEPYTPHAWPEKYRLALDWDGVGLAAFGQSVAVMTTGHPYVATGSAPEAMVMERLEVNFPCVASRGIVDMGYAAVYPCPDGLVTISNGGATLVSRAIVGRDAWQALRPATFVASQHDGRYIATWTKKDGTRDTLIFDMTGESPFLTHVDPIADFMFFEVGAGTLYLLQGASITEWDAPERPPMTARWKSKPYIHTGGFTFGAMLVEGDAYEPAADDGIDPIASISDGIIVSGSYSGSNDNATGDQSAPAPDAFTTKVYAGGQVVRESLAFGEIDRIGAALQRQWEIEIIGGNTVTAASLGFTPSELSTSRGA